MFRIRKFRKDDTKEVIRVVTTSLRQLFNCKNKDLGDNLIENLSDIKRNYFVNGGAFFVGEYFGKVIGTVAILPETKNSAKLKRMYLYKEYRGKGFGSKLYDFAERWCKGKGYKRIILSTYPHFKEAIRMYESKGYKKFKRTKEQIFFYKKL
jgi:putative acetyltransferase